MFRQSCAACGKFSLWVATARSQWLTPRTSFTPASSAPIDAPPAPQNRSVSDRYDGFLRPIAGRLPRNVQPELSGPLQVPPVRQIGGDDLVDRAFLILSEGLAVGPGRVDGLGPIQAGQEDGQVVVRRGKSALDDPGRLTPTRRHHIGDAGNVDPVEPQLVALDRRHAATPWPSSRRASMYARSCVATSARKRASLARTFSSTRPSSSGT